MKFFFCVWIAYWWNDGGEYNSPCQKLSDRDVYMPSRTWYIKLQCGRPCCPLDDLLSSARGCFRCLNIHITGEILLLTAVLPMQTHWSVSWQSRTKSLVDHAHDDDRWDIKTALRGRVRVTATRRRGDIKGLACVTGTVDGAAWRGPS